MIRRYRFREDNLGVQEVDGMYVTKLYCTVDELSRLLKEKMSAEAQKKFKDCTFIPVYIGINDADLTIEATFLTDGRKSEC